MNDVVFYVMAGAQILAQIVGITVSILGARKEDIYDAHRLTAIGFRICMTASLGWIGYLGYLIIWYAFQMI